MPKIDNTCIAQESPKTQRAREKLQARFDAENKRLTPQALAETVSKIHEWIASNAQHRVPLKKEGMRLFAQNAEAVAASHKVQKLASRLREGHLD